MGYSSPGREMATARTYCTEDFYRINQSSTEVGVVGKTSLFHSFIMQVFL